jgi:hypothetical protein
LKERKYTEQAAEATDQQDDYVLHYAGSLTFPFQPDTLSMCEQGKMYHAGPEVGGGLSLISSHLALDLSKTISFDDALGSLVLRWKDGRTYPLHDVPSSVYASAL